MSRNDDWKYVKKEFLRLSKTLFSCFDIPLDFIKKVENVDIFSCPHMETYSFIDGWLVWSYSPYNKPKFYWWKLQTVFILYLVLSNRKHNLNTKKLHEVCVNYFKGYFTFENVLYKNKQKDLYLLFRPLLYKKKLMGICHNLDVFFNMKNE